MNVSDMPDVHELRSIARTAFETLRSNPPTLVLSQAASTLVFAQTELRWLGCEQVYHEENRRHELLKRGFLPPDALDAAPGIAQAARPDELTEAQCEQFRRLPGSFNDMVRAIFRAGWEARGRVEARDEIAGLDRVALLRRAG